MLIPLLLSFATAGWKQLPADGSQQIHSLWSFGDSLVACGTGGCASNTSSEIAWTVTSSPFTTIEPSFDHAFGVAKTDQGIFRTPDRMRTWIPWGEGLPPGIQAHQIATGGGVAFLTAGLPGTAGGNDLCGWFVRTSNAKTWTAVGTTTRNTWCGDIAVEPDGSLLRIAPDAANSGEGTIQRSHNNGLSWDSVAYGIFENIGSNIHGVRRASWTPPPGSVPHTPYVLSLDSGKTWTDSVGVPHGSTAWIDPRTHRTAFLAHDSIPGPAYLAWTGTTLWASGRNGLFSSRDSGITWIRADRSFPMGVAMDIRWSGGFLAVIGIHGNSIFLETTSDDGRHWMQFPVRVGWPLMPCNGMLLVEGSTSNGIPVLFKVTGTAIDPAFASAAPPRTISCNVDGGDSDYAIYGLDGSLFRFNVGWSNLGFDGTGYPSELVVSKKGIFFLTFPASGRPSVQFQPKLERFTIPISGLPEAIGIFQTLRGVLVTTKGGLFRCTDASDCTRLPLPGIDTSWSFTKVTSQGKHVVLGATGPSRTSSGFPESVLLTSSDTGITWSAIDIPFVPSAATVSPAGLYAASVGQGIWFLDSTVTSTTPRVGREGPTITHRNREIVLSELTSPAKLILLNADGRRLMESDVVPREGMASIRLPGSIHGIVFATIRTPSGLKSRAISLP